MCKQHNHRQGSQPQVGLPAPTTKLEKFNMMAENKAKYC